MYKNRYKLSTIESLYLFLILLKTIDVRFIVRYNNSMEEFLNYFNSLDNKDKEYSFAGNDNSNNNIRKYIIWFDKNSSKSYSEIVYVVMNIKSVQYLEI
ncbi:hypothetical protein CNEO4_2450011 [Clostridium neonatale]|uniref:Uncharacterized protein n=2 Tax=Clostridium neonatale TaxID=137838 RepID=A0AA86MGX2_9CLOT|nr:hypothetical protein CNEO_10084 [Clostridium neonatale]CAG9713070.1 hypothetical protein CNEO_1870010 [Clostridium neonatale]CAI3192622.1 hypothetical protein CNEO2_1080012 [Clostridium neonatale]CAI3211699.1 hypothetical protein CNEO2_700030 [Clostridium neonatale]CAI3214219.1 hypothetical protein CNEO2_710010 [Clostridium neonatale]